jgi:hypothetical protein
MILEYERKNRRKSRLMVHLNKTLIENKGIDLVIEIEVD